MIPQISYYIAPALKGEITKESIIEMICFKYSVTFEELVSQNRTPKLVFARHLCMFLLYTQAKINCKEVGRILHRDHTTVIHARQSILNYIETNSLNKREEIHKMINRCEYRIL